MSTGRYIMRPRVFQGWAFATRALAGAGVQVEVPNLICVHDITVHKPSAISITAHKPTAANIQRTEC